jgi:putative DNA methylase
MTYRKKLIEVALPLDAINKASAREKSIRHGHPSTLHLWWARRPLATARAVIFAQMVDDPSANPDLFPTAKTQEKERQRLFQIIEDLVQWENTTNDEVLERARAEIWQSWRRACADNADHPRARELFNRNKLPTFHDPFAGGGTFPLEAQRLGLEAHASDLNPVAVLINKAMIEIPPMFAGWLPVNPKARSERTTLAREWNGAQGLADDIRYYGRWMRDEAEKRIGDLYPKIAITKDMARARPDLRPLVGKKLVVIAWLWARTVRSPNPAFRKVDVPLASSFVLSAKSGNEAYVEPVVGRGSYSFSVRIGQPRDPASTKNGTRLSRGANFRCLMSGTAIEADHIRAEGKAGRLGARLMAVVAEGKRGRVFLPATEEQEMVARQATPDWKPDVEFFQQALGFRVGKYGMTKWSDLFTNRQLIALATFADLVQEARELVKRDALAADIYENKRASSIQGRSPLAYADAAATYLALAVSKAADMASTLCLWQPNPQHLKIAHTYARNALPMSWDFAEGNPFSESSGNFGRQRELVAQVLDELPATIKGTAAQADAASSVGAPSSPVCSTDPPYFDNIGYADLSDFFYVWLRRSLKSTCPDLFATLVVPKIEELVATPDRHGGKEKAEAFFLEGMRKVLERLAETSHPAFPVTLYYAFKQSESNSEQGTASTGWERFLDAVIQAGFGIGGTWPMRTERPGRLRDIGSNALASSIVLVCRPRAAEAATATRREFVAAVKRELPGALAYLQRSNIAPVDLAQAAIGPGMEIYTRYARVLDAEGRTLSVREALALINETLDEVLADHEGDFDADTRWALAWCEQVGFADGKYGLAETLSKAKNTSVGGMVEAGIVQSRRGKVRLLRPDELPADWDPSTDSRLTVWEMVHHMIRLLEAAGEGAAAELSAKLGVRAEVARELAYHLYTVSVRRKRAQDALRYNALVQSWPEIARLAWQDTTGRGERRTRRSEQTTLLGQE